MNRLILKYKYPITFAILAVLAWVVYRIFSGGSGLIAFVVVAVLVWGLGTCVFIYFGRLSRTVPTNERSLCMGSAAAPSPSIRCTRCPSSLRPRRHTPAY